MSEEKSSLRKDYPYEECLPFLNGKDTGESRDISPEMDMRIVSH